MSSQDEKKNIYLSLLVNTKKEKNKSGGPVQLSIIDGIFLFLFFLLHI